LTDGYVVKDSGGRTEFETGSVRDLETDKLDWTLVRAFHPALVRFAAHLMKGAGKYGRHNWRKGQSLARAERSMERHLAAYMNGERDEDHLAALVFNAFLIQDHEARIASGQLPASLDDRDEWRACVSPDSAIIPALVATWGDFHDAAGANTV